MEHTKIKQTKKKVVSGSQKIKKGQGSQKTNKNEREKKRGGWHEYDVQ